jgi:hypothetical protein
MITIVAPIAMIAKKLASVAVCTSVYEFQKLLTVSPSADQDASRQAPSASPDDDAHHHEPDSGEPNSRLSTWA